MPSSLGGGSPADSAGGACSSVARGRLVLQPRALLETRLHKRHTNLPSWMRLLPLSDLPAQHVVREEPRVLERLARQRARRLGREPAL
eukprot:CAMPEP_0202740208 /NCGR_PEP_ID=MMETSP1388-20130828/3388_1 /ASSEMBLY_ACC=CAM_ASM_000864 /TAXON_ID=37098 /ORGANISM="Isochrysis sp, Strain CCMP1244" /LENGTH=87 /DNA_ID=CAMNT_0049406943 /DNA_START=55 /DNA_END=315 /DNA_ORIENTATION=+